MLKILAILVSIEVALVVHESAHFVAMRAYGVEVKEMSIGIGPVLYEKQFDNLHFTVKAIPIMAYVAPSKSGVEKLNKMSFPRLVIIMLAGVFTNLVLASLVFLWLKSREASQEEFPIVQSGVLSLAISLPKKYLFMFKDLLLEMVLVGRPPENKGALFLKRTPGPLLKWMLFLNLILGIANALPVGFLDGGKVFIALLMMILSLVSLVVPLTAENVNMILAVVNLVTFFMFITLIFRGIRTQFIVFEQDKDKDKDKDK